MQLGIFIPIGNNGWMMSTAAPQYLPSFELNRTVAERAEAAGFEFLLSMVKLRGFGGATEFWDHNLESFTLMAGLAAVTKKIQLYASVAIPTMNPAIVARMASTIDDISGGRFGINIVSGWNQSEYVQMGVWPGDWYYDRRYEYSREFVTVMQELWRDGRSDLKGEFFTMDDCLLSPRPSAGKVPLVCAGQSDVGMEFCATYGDYQFIIGTADLDVVRADAARLGAAAAKTGRDVGVYVLFQITMGDTDAAAEAKWNGYRDAADLDAIAFMTGQANLDTSGATAEKITEMKGAFNLNIGPIVGSHATIAARLDEIAEIPGVAGVMCVFDDYPVATEEFGAKVMPLMKSRN
ncbi:MAG: pyrimidine utilization protein A [Acidimicrobiia bacterium]|nr:pyrimidine utilization protein A [Acidimicrobiia bacterium]